MCNNHFIVNQIPKTCPHCEQEFNKHAEPETVTDVIYNFFVRKTDEKGYMECDPLGWVKGQDLPMPEDLRRDLGDVT